MSALSVEDFTRAVSGGFVRPRKSESEVLSRREGRLSECAMVFDRLGTSILPLATNVCEGASSGSIEVEAFDIPAMDVVTPGILTPPTWRTSNGPEMTLVWWLVMTVLQRRWKGIVSQWITSPVKWDTPCRDASR